MLKRILNHYANRLVSRWVILFIDLILVIISFVLAYAIRFNFSIDTMSGHPMGLQLAVVAGFYLLGFLIFRPYSGIIRHTSIRDVEHILLATGSAAGTYLLINLISDFYGFLSEFRMSYSVLIIHFLVITFAMISIRFFIKSFYFNVVRKKSELRQVMIYGAGKSGMITRNALEQDERYKYRIAGFIDDNPSKVGKKLEGIPVFAKKTISPHLLKQMNIAEVIIAIQKIPAAKKREIVEFFLEMDVIIKNTPSTSQWIDGELSSKQIRTIRIEDLLERDEIRLDHKNVKSQVADQVVMVTGAAGSIGSEICRQLLYYKPKKLILIDQAESALYELLNDLEHRFNGLVRDRVVPFVCDVCNQVRTERIFEQFRPNVVYHAAAYKHVPLMELNPQEAVEVNVFGTKNIVDLAIHHQADSFVLVSTDKAVNPTNIMGASKRIAEMYCQSRQKSQKTHTKFITTRFGTSGSIDVNGYTSLSASISNATNASNIASAANSAFTAGQQAYWAGQTQGSILTALQNGDATAISQTNDAINSFLSNPALTSLVPQLAAAAGNLISNAGRLSHYDGRQLEREQQFQLQFAQQIQFYLTQDTFDDCKQAANDAFDEALTEIDSILTAQLQLIQDQYDSQLPLIEGQRAGLEASALTNHNTRLNDYLTIFNTTANTIATSFGNGDITVAERDLLTMVNIATYAASVNSSITLYNTELALISSLIAQATTNLLTTRNALTAQANINYNNELQRLTKIRDDTVRSCHNQGGTNVS